ncbi:(Fe-S)-binding protein [Ruficoccus sp. ZRK36]|uniref:(Fe-S)-binding protein n=1 Tax=Ruficoccus sp. ZRK36 TaxID=2866311 RepID=UPI001C7356FF|nr:(Fe-S)-binding protein [Ruficoccus sp. ZRK36]QYY34332.1 (Fe-S)-binding protein [Ruficoccus sp. ZRK36]
MNTDSYRDVINACRFCFMCRHLATTANVSFREADIPRGNALIIDRLSMKPEQWSNPDFIKTFYDNTLSAACRKHCVSHFDEAGLALAARCDVVEQGLAPAEVQAVADALKADFDPQLSGEGCEVLYLKSTTYTAGAIAAADAFAGLMELAGVSYETLSVSDTGKALGALGYTKDAAELAAQVKALIEKSGCKSVVVSCPAAYDALKNDFAKWGAALDSIEVLHTSEYLLKLVESGKLKLPENASTVYYIDSDFLRNYNDMAEEPRALLKAAGCDLRPLGTNAEESFALGEGSVVFDKIRPTLAARLRARLIQEMDSTEDILVTASPYTYEVLTACTEPKLNVLTLEQACLAQAQTPAAV